MNIFRYPSRDEWQTIVKRPQMDVSSLNEVVNGVLADIRTNGDEAVRRYEKKFDHVCLNELQVTEEEMKEAELLVDKGREEHSPGIRMDK